MRALHFPKLVCLVVISCFMLGFFPIRPLLLLAGSPAVKPILGSPSEEVYWYKLPLPVTWEPVANAVSYEVTVWDSLSLSKPINTTTSITSYTISPGQLTMNQFYSVCVRANFADKTVSDESYRCPFYLDGGGTPGNAPDKPTLRNPLYDDVVDLPLTFQWSFQSSARSFELTIWDHLQTKKLLSQTVSRKKFTLSSGLLPGNQYYYASVRAMYPNGSVSGESDRVFFYLNSVPGENPPPPPPENPPPPPPQDPSPKNQVKILTPASGAQIVLPYTFTWTSMSGISQYTIHFWNAGSELLFSQALNRYTNFFSVSRDKLTPDSDYFVSVDASFLDGSEVSHSEKVPFRVMDPNSAVSKPTILNPTSDQTIDLPYVVTWTSVEGTSFYQIQVFNKTQTAVVLRDTVAESVQAYLLRSSSLIAGQDYYVCITAVNKDPAKSGTSSKVLFHVNKPMKMMTFAENLVLNSSVEIKTTAGQPKDWTKERWGSNNTIFSYATTGHSGSYALKVQIKAYTSGDAKWVARTIPVTAGQSFLYTDWYQSNITSHIVIHYTKADGSDEYQELITPPPASTWTMVSDSFQVPLNAVSMEVFHLINQVGWLITDDFEIRPYTPTGFSTAMVSITFDDGWEYNVTSALPILKTNQFKSTYFFATTYLEKSPATGSASVSGPTAVRLIQSEGHEIGSHSVTHPFMSSLTPSVLTYELTHSKQYLESLAGVGQITSFATPYGDYNDTVINAIKGYYQVHRPTDVGYNSVDNLEPYRLKVQNLLSTTTQAEFTSWVEEAVRSKLWLVLVYHKITNTNILQYDTKIADFTAHMALLKNKSDSGLLAVKKINEIIPGNVPPPTPTTGKAYFSSNPSGATVSIGGVNKGITPFSGDFAPGTYSAVFTLNGYTGTTQNFSITAGGQTNVSATLNPIPTTKPVILTPGSGAQISLPYTVSWAGVTGSWYYTVKIWDNARTYPIVQLSTSNLTQTIPKGLLQNQSYTLSVTATTSTGTVTESSKITFVVIDSPPSPDPIPDPSPSDQPTILTPASGESVILPYLVTWSAVTNVSFYQIQVFNQAQSAIVLRDTIPAGTHQYRLGINSLNSGFDYYVLITAIARDSSKIGESLRILFRV